MSSGTGVERPNPPQATPAEQHKLLYEAFIDAYKGFVEFGLKNGAFLTLILGWILSSSDAQVYLSRHSGMRYIAIASTLLYAIAHTFWLYRWRARSEWLRKLLVDLNFMNPEFYRPSAISPRILISIVFLHWAITVQISIFIATLAQLPQ